MFFLVPSRAVLFIRVAARGLNIVPHRSAVTLNPSREYYFLRRFLDVSAFEDDADAEECAQRLYRFTQRFALASLERAYLACVSKRRMRAPSSPRKPRPMCS